MPKPDDPYRKGSTEQIAEVLDASTTYVWGAITRIKKETGYAVPHVNVPPRKKRRGGDA